MSSQDVIEKINNILTGEFEIEPELLRAEADLYEEIELDSLDAVDLVIALEKTFEIKIAEDTMREIRTLDQLHQMVHTAIA